MQLDCELIDVTDDFRALRFVLFQFAANFFGVGSRARVWFCRLRNGGLLPAFLTGQVHAGGGPVRYQRCFATLAMKENVGTRFNFADRVHSWKTSRGYAAVSHIQFSEKCI